MTTTPLISIIVPVYNVEPYLRKCADSILSQTYTNIEAIFIDDGSSDGCPAICDEYAAKDSRVVVIHQKNAGVCAARNAGLDIAKGEYISFVDDDDWIEPDMYEVLYEIMMMSNSDISASYSCYGDYKPEKVSTNEHITLSPKQAIQELLDNKHDFTSVWGKLFKREIINDLLFDSDIAIAEDTLFTTEAFVRSRKVSFISYQCYHYVVRPDSASHKFSESFWSNLTAVDRIIDTVMVFDNSLGQYAANHVAHLDICILKTAEANGKLSEEGYKKVMAHIRKYISRDSWMLLSIYKKCWLFLLLLGRKPFIAARKVSMLLKSKRQGNTL